MDLKEFLDSARKLKAVKRSGWVLKGVREPESVADHSFMLALMAMVLSERRGLNQEKAMKMALIHDLPEVFTGDIPSTKETRRDRKKMEEKKKRELDGARKIFLLLPEGKKLLSLWLEFDEGKTPEARLVKDLDKLEMALQAIEYGKTKSGVAADFLEDARENIKDSELTALLKEISEGFRTSYK